VGPVLVEATRGDRVESRHRGAVAVVDAEGGVAFAVGDIEQAVFPRSAVKAIQALPLVESGAADRFGLTTAELALACASHRGEPLHVATAESMLRKAGRDASALECGAHWPRESAGLRLAASGGQPTALHNNCSGKHSGFICLACHRGDDPAGYVRPDHPTMRVVVAALADMTGATLDQSNRGIDGCSIPSFAIPLRALALAFARLATGQGLAAERAQAAARLRAAVAQHPFMVGGTESFDTALMRITGPAVFSKAGAEGVFCVALPTLGLGVAIKCDDGTPRAAEVATAATIAGLLPDLAPAIAHLVRRDIVNWNGITTGQLRPADALA